MLKRSCRSAALVHTDILMEPASLQFGSVEQGKASEAQVRLYRADFPNWQIAPSVRFSDPNLQGEVIPVARQGSRGLVRLESPFGPFGPIRLYQ